MREGLQKIVTSHSFKTMLLDVIVSLARLPIALSIIWLSCLLTVPGLFHSPGGEQLSLPARHLPIPPETPAPPEPAAPRQYVTHHHLRLSGQELAYSAIAGDTHLTNPAGEWIGDIFSFSYLLDDSTQRNRPVLFIFNGGPGSSSVWLHLGIVGPRRVVLSSEVNPSTVPPFGLTDNPYCPLDVADLVFIDPVGTGYSHIAGVGKPADFFGVEADADIAAQFIERWLSRHGRWNSPKFVMGESYGSTRAALLPNALLGGPTYQGVMRGITLNGIILLGTTLGQPGPPTTAQARARRSALALPAMAATAWYHHPGAYGGKSLAALHDEATQFAERTYLPALLRAGRAKLPLAERQRLLSRLTYYTGLSISAFGKQLQISQQDFARQLLARQHRAVGLYDSRYTLPSLNAGPDPVADDPAMAQYMPGFVTAFHDYLRTDLGVPLEQPYQAIVWRGVNQRWRWDRAAPAGQDVAVDLAAALRRNSRLRVLVAAGYYDLATTAALAHYELSQAAPPNDQVTYRTYASGHMLYLGDTAGSFAADVRALIRQAR